MHSKTYELALAFSPFDFFLFDAEKDGKMTIDRKEFRVCPRLLSLILTVRRSPFICTLVSWYFVVRINVIPPMLLLDVGGDCIVIERGARSCTDYASAWRAETRNLLSV